MYFRQTHILFPHIDSIPDPHMCHGPVIILCYDVVECSSSHRYDVEGE